MPTPKIDAKLFGANLSHGHGWRKSHFHIGLLALNAAILSGIPVQRNKPNVSKTQPKHNNTTMTSSRAYRQAFLLVLITTAAAIDPSSSSSLLRSESSRRSLTQKTGSNINNNYVTHSEKHTFRTAFLGCCAAVGTLVGLLFLVDKEVSFLLCIELRISLLHLGMLCNICC